MPTPPPPPLSPQLQGTYNGLVRDYDRGHQQPAEVNGGGPKVFSPPEERRGRSSVHVIHPMERAMSPPPVIARKPIAIPYTELVNMSNQVLNLTIIANITFYAEIFCNKNMTIQVVPETLKIQVGPFEVPEAISYPSPPAPTHAPYRNQMSPTPVNGNRRSSEHIMDALSNKVTIKFPNGKSASAGNKSLESLMASAPPPQAANHGILKDAPQKKHKTVIQQKNITFGEM
jgi:hypothetical protein